jgi:diguanylate cyclase (GGDEF)-like protein
MPLNQRQAHILVVDDDPVNLLLTCQCLSAEGYSTIEAENGESAIKSFTEKSYDLVLLDVIMPGIDGFEVCRQLRGMPGGRQVPVLIMTGLDDDVSILKAYEAGATDFITKPITWSLLIHRIRYMLRANDAMHALAQSRTGLANAQRIAKMGSWDYHPLHNELHWSEEVFRILEMHPKKEGYPYKTFLEVVHPDDRNRFDQIYRKSLRAGKSCEIEFRLMMPDSRIKWVNIRGISDDEGSASNPHYMAIIQDITDRKLAETRVQFLAYYDELTGLPNRNLFQENLHKEIQSARRHGRRLAVLMFNLNRFRRINETFGHTTGDLLLKQIGERIRKNVRGSDYTARLNSEGIEVVRWAGDEFAVTATDLISADSAGRIAQRVLSDLNKPCQLEDNEITMTACAGIAVFPEDGNNVDDLIKNAQSALWSARKSGPSTYKFYSHSMNAHAHQHILLESALRRALEHNQLELFYQPLVKADSFEIMGAEALLRWRHPEKGMIPPGEFIPLAEETGLIIPIGEWVLSAACTQGKAWQNAGHKAITLAINLSAVHFRRNVLLNHVRQALSKTGMEGIWLDLEITESALMQDLDISLGIMEEIRALGIRFSIDDFGTGYSSLSYLKRLPVHSLKIDRSFVCNLPDDGEDLAIVRAIVAIGHSLNVAVIAEGVETMDQARLLAAEGVDLLQGYLFSRPVPDDVFSSLLTTGIIPPKGSEIE